ncbi:MAG: FAD:protein FMN transferase [Lachnospiraceae bacterium]|nr:FAD:protein FMN transferase [Lachnospiraceae bacterium]MDE7204269.1 FAD:protein FMN transferase [Lachnospiraceae bacterium]
MNHSKLFLTGSVLLLSAIIMTGCAKTSSQTPISQTGFAFDTVVTITIYDKQRTDVLEHCFALCEQYESLFSATREDSEIWKINHADGAATAVSYDTASLIQSALYYCDQSNGVLDLTLRPIAEEWDISGQMERADALADYEYYIPSEQTLSALLEHVNYQNVMITDADGNELGYRDPLSEDNSYFVTLKDAQNAIDLGFIAKGYIADCLKEYLLKESVDSGIISLGGNILLIGSKPDGSSYHVGIQKPFGAANEIITTIQENDTSVVSSGCYERYFMTDEHKKDGTIYHHIFDTTTGCPVQNDLLGVTILSDSSMEGDALSTYCYLLGLEKGMEYIQSLENVEALFVTKDYEVIRSS